MKISKSADPSAIVVPFGKHKGATVAELLATDAEYANWILAQGWVAERFAELHAAIATRGAGTDDTPEHNALQARFLDEDFRNALLSLITQVDRIIADASGRMLDQARYEIELFNEPRYGWEKITEARALHAAEVVRRVNAKEVRLTSSVVAFERAGIDVIISATGTLGDGFPPVYETSVELKPTMGDDYPTVLRQMARLKCKTIVVGSYTGRGVSEPQLRQIFEASGFRLVFVQEIEEAMRRA